MSRLARLANLAASFVRARMYGATEESAARGIASEVGPFDDGEPPKPPKKTEDDEPDESIEFLGRGEQYDEESWERFVSNMRHVDSSNVYAYGFRAETPRMGILYVTYLDYVPASLGGSGERSGPGPTYAYYDIPLAKYRAFESMAESSAGSAVWDYCRVRGSKFEHQHRYQIVQVNGNYVPRKATAKGYKRRSVAALGMGGNRGGFRGQQLPEETRKFRRQQPVRRGEPNRGRPNRGR
jgi:hypothetical protein